MLEKYSNDLVSFYRTNNFNYIWLDEKGIVEYGNSNIELMLTGLYLFYAKNVYKGIDNKSTTAKGWLLPHKKISYTGLLDSIIKTENMQKADSLILFSQYYKLHDVYKRDERLAMLLYYK